MGNEARRRFLEQGLAVLAVLLAFLVRWLLDPILHDRLPYPTFFVAVIFAAWYGGWRAALPALALSLPLMVYFFVDPRYHFSINRLDNLVEAALLVFVGLATAAFSEVQRAARRRGAVAEEQQERPKRIEAEESLRVAMEQLRIVTDSMAALVTRCSRDLRYLWVSKSYADWIGRPAEELVGRPILDVIGHSAFESLRPRFERVLSGEKVAYEDLVDYRGIGQRWVHAIYTPTFDSDCAPDGWVAVVLDVTDRKRMEEALAEANRRKDEFLATLAHELRNPIAPIQNAVQYLDMKGQSDPELQRTRSIIHRQLEQLIRLVDDLRDISRITCGKIELRKERIDLGTVVERAIDTSRPLIEAYGHELKVAIPPGPVWVEADLARMAQVVANLLNNSAKYTEPGGHIRLTVAEECAEVVIRVRDDGIGIPAEMLPRIFDLFTQVDNSVERQHGGLGIGLTLVKNLVEMHGGSVAATSEGPGHGSELILRLPAAAEVTKGAVPLGSKEDGRAGSPAPGRRVLLADDNKDAAESLAMLLKLMGHEVHAVLDGPQALEAAATYRPEVVILDIGMPGMSGYEVARRLRQQPEGRHVLLVALTGWGSPEDQRRTKEAGFDHHLVKPVDFEILQKLLTGPASPPP